MNPRRSGRTSTFPSGLAGTPAPPVPVTQKPVRLGPSEFALELVVAGREVKDEALKNALDGAVARWTQAGAALAAREKTDVRGAPALSSATVSSLGVVTKALADAEDQQVRDILLKFFAFQPDPGNLDAISVAAEQTCAELKRAKPSRAVPPDAGEASGMPSGKGGAAAAGSVNAGPKSGTVPRPGGRRHYHSVGSVQSEVTSAILFNNDVTGLLEGYFGEFGEQAYPSADAAKLLLFITQWRATTGLERRCDAELVQILPPARRKDVLVALLQLPDDAASRADRTHATTLVLASLPDDADHVALLVWLLAAHADQAPAILARLDAMCAADALRATLEAAVATQFPSGAASGGQWIDSAFAQGVCANGADFWKAKLLWRAESDAGPVSGARASAPAASSAAVDPEPAPALDAAGFCDAIGRSSATALKSWLDAMTKQHIEKEQEQVRKRPIMRWIRAALRVLTFGRAFRLRIWLDEMTVPDASGRLVSLSKRAESSGIPGSVEMIHTAIAKEAFRLQAARRAGTAW